jgi:alkylated DNA nucleotide flippase Atl1
MAVGPWRATSSTDLSQAVAAVVAAIPPGEVMSYGQVALLAGRSGAARAVGQMLARSHGLPWWRVVARNGRLVPGMEVEHAYRLMEEGLAARPVTGPQPSLLTERRLPLPTGLPTRAATAGRGGQSRSRANLRSPASTAQVEDPLGLAQGPLQ